MIAKMQTGWLAAGCRWGRTMVVGAMAVVLAAGALANAERPARVPKPGEFNPEHGTVELFAAIEAGEVEAKLIPKDSSECRLLVTNKTDRPLNVALPGAFAGVPVLAQFGGGMGGGGMGGMGGGGEGIGGGMGGGGMGGMGGGGGGGFFNIPAERVAQIKGTTVCLEHGKPEPRPAMAYEIKPIESFTDKPEVQELCRMVGSGRINQRAAQAAAWHLNNGMSWAELAAKQTRYANGATQPYFHPQELQAAVRITQAAVDMAKQRQESGDDSLSASMR